MFACFSGLILPAMPYLRNSKLLLMMVAGIFLAASAPFQIGAQQQAADINGREVLEEVLTQTYQLSIVGKGMMGVGSASAIRRAGTIVLVQKPGLSGWFDRNQIASSSIHGDMRRYTTETMTLRFQLASASMFSVSRWDRIT